jgi:hypothetical protein
MNPSITLRAYGPPTERRTSGISDSTATEQLAVRISPENPNHHLWNNHGVWWTHFTVHRPDYTKKRIRLSLGTRDLEQARRIRDLFLAGFGGVQLEG